MTRPTLTQEEVAALAAAVRDGEDVPDFAAAAARSRRVVEYDFAAPIRLSPDQHYQLERLYEGYCRRTTTRVSPTIRTLMEMEVISVEQLIWSEAIQRLPEHFAATIVVDAAESLQTMVCSDLAFVWHCTNRLLGGAAGLSWGSSRTHITDIERTMADVVFDQFVAELQDTWTSVTPVTMRSSGVRVDAGNSHLAPAREPTVLISIEVRFDRQSHVLWLVQPYRALEFAASRLVQGYLDGDHSGAGDRSMIETMGEVEVEARVEIGATHLSIADVLSIGPGALLSFDERADLMTIFVASEPVFRVQPGRDGTRRALRILDVVDLEETF